eukprot:Skav220891  [mRNA]  locus=scaffold3880:33191:35076:+ [translate_table: standard]
MAQNSCSEMQLVSPRICKHPVRLVSGLVRDACAVDGLILNIGFPLEELQYKDRWFLYTLEADSLRCSEGRPW